MSRQFVCPHPVTCPSRGSSARAEGLVTPDCFSLSNAVALLGLPVHVPGDSECSQFPGEEPGG